MSLVDTTFASLPAGLLAQWGQDVTYVKASTAPSYDATTGQVNGVDTTVTVRALITEAKPALPL